MVSYSAKLDSRTKQHSQFGVSASNGSRDMGRTKSRRKKKEKIKKKKRKKNEHRQNYIASPTGIANDLSSGIDINGSKSKPISLLNPLAATVRKYSIPRKMSFYP